MAVHAQRLERDLAAAVRGEVRFDSGSTAMYATDASNYRQVPVGVVVPADPDDAVAAVAVCRAHDAPVLSRGGGTSLAGECCNAAVVLDWSKYANRVESVDVTRRRAVVQPGVVLDSLLARTRADGLVFGPRPATHDRCTVGGMIGNNSCGSTAQWSGTTAANVERLEILTYDGTRMWVGETTDAEYARIQAAGGVPAEIHRAVRDLRDRYADRVRSRFPQLPRRISGYNLDELLPERGMHLARALVGTEGTCVTVLRAELALVPAPETTAMVLLGYRDVFAAAAAVPVINRHRPLVVEGVDHKLLSFQERKDLNPTALERMPEAGAWLLVELPGDSEEQAHERARTLCGDPDLGTVEATVVDDPTYRRQVWTVRESGLGATALVPGLPDTWEGWEDSAVPPERLSDYLRALYGLLREFGYQDAALYGHFGHGCVHTRIPFDLVTDAGVADFRRFLRRAAELVVAYGGSLSGEHGDGQARGELLEVMYGEELVGAFRELKAIFDPRGRMNPGKVVDAYPVDTNLRLGPGYEPPRPETYFAYPEDGGNFTRAAQRCVGVGKCRRTEGGVMCPSYMVTREEKHSTRGRARLLWEMMTGDLAGEGWRSPAVHEALDLCLACKGCKSDCPVDVDMASYKAEFLAHHYAGRVRPREHYALGWLPLWAQLSRPAPWLANAAWRTPGLGRLARRVAGVDPQREMPRFAAARFSPWLRRRGTRGSGHRGQVLLLPDTFTDGFQPETAVAAVVALGAAGFQVVVPDRPVCCGLTWISTGQLNVARRVLDRTVRILADYRMPVVGLEPSCTGVLRADATELLAPGTASGAAAASLAENTYTLAELLGQQAPEFAPQLTTTGGGAPDAVVQTHCHQHAIMGFEADRKLMERIGLEAKVLDSGCCGLAGDFGMTRPHRDVSLACAERVLLPAVRDADPATLVLADGFSCRTQIAHARTGRRATHMAEVLAAAVRGDRLGTLPERDLLGGDRWRR